MTDSLHALVLKQRPRRWAVGAGSVLLALTACGTSAPTPTPTPGPATLPLRFNQPVVLLGEVHDNAAQHALRLRLMQAWLAEGARPALLMEQFDRERQPDIDRVRALPAATAQAVIDAASHAMTTTTTAAAAAATTPGAGWNWAFYKPFIELALAHGLPIVAVNVSRADARLVMRQGLAAQGFAAAVPADIQSATTQAVQASHCGQIDAPTAERMALAQVARDQFMARAVELHAARGVLLLAGNGHVRRDIGVPRWLSPATRQRSEAIGVLEHGTSTGIQPAADPLDSPAAFDRRIHSPAQIRPDPCAGWGSKAK